MTPGLRRHTFHVTSQAVEWMMTRFGAAQTAEIVRNMVVQAGFGHGTCLWQSAPGRGLTVRGFVREEVGQR